MRRCGSVAQPKASSDPEDEAVTCFLLPTLFDQSREISCEETSADENA